MQLTKEQVIGYTKSCGDTVCPDFDTNVLNGQWNCTLDNKPVQDKYFPDNVECIFSCQSRDISKYITCDKGQWKVCMIDNAQLWMIFCTI